ncbi:gliding motility lipoprotein GldH [Parabacteroides sp. PF5-6]|uniref:gliding motility lipoprotein GldH n=1 Tax=Parabacteroides sp. PF5-6 TaxID=1742403 RepID=UPI002406F100|nr:gliding motility lipoprotein GldH [Parabacteroides sp. PF5-6]MDF9831493.1 gliding motility-associated lipoprotein GldH [Parabacteroides sp. PF5-6]
MRSLIVRRNLMHNRLSGVVIRLCCLWLLCTSCTDRTYYEQYQTIDNKCWAKDAEYYFTFEITDTSAAYDLTVEIRNNDRYPYQNLWLFHSEQHPSGPLVRDTTECLLADDYGRWLGTGISLFQSSHTLRSSYHFKEAGSYTLAFRQGMRNEALPGIQQIGLRITQRP